MKNKNLIIGAATGYKKNELYFFIESLRKVYFDKVILIVNKNITEETRNYLNLNKIDIFFSKYKSKTIFKDRYSLYYEIIKNQLNIENIMLTDTADVIFFDDPFKNELFSEINFFLEDKLNQPFLNMQDSLKLKCQTSYYLHKNFLYHQLDL